LHAKPKSRGSRGEPAAEAAGSPRFAAKIYAFCAIRSAARERLIRILNSYAAFDPRTPDYCPLILSSAQHIERSVVERCSADITRCTFFIGRYGNRPGFE
jgi:hypothetical protein